MAGAALAPAKVNLFLHVGAPGADGYHPLCSLIAFADFGDRLLIHEAEALGLMAHGRFARDLPAEGENLALRAARALIAEARRPIQPFGLSLDKRLPVAAGLGGGSSDAGAALRLIRQALELDISDARLEAVAASLGSDGPACLWARPTIAQGRGERLSPAPGLPVLDAVLVNPGAPAPTAQVYRRFDEIGRFGEVAPPPAPESFESAVELAGWLAGQRNDLQGAAISVAPEIGAALETLAGEPECLLARVSGSGATSFALCASDIEADSLAQRVVALEPRWWVRRCRLGGPWADGD
ncbi:MAG TPA: 4-(cytidine 5'-diphospho)-2-C-methyl-D-erythritol kinase [Phenylobacterium sp.]|uniref:4-(cytidine 5'-diphospho)-2-C-methyl-D-erythritol kinase n=1 Tax=Phenylobacterium sp. TaxID=1871053 RepID=UPI002BA68E27|nr:4-(cytidine 5'-diphospho)-2-C-methyl-D-erythritol kinase [Phenylobacterium sp.]HSV02456.1 4-(cytidine 5'-diphospho)-2-C-methyl-D-erythritol kinase [Phenylobacterium sp.]